MKAPVCPYIATVSLAGFQPDASSSLPQRVKTEDRSHAFSSCAPDADEKGIQTKGKTKLCAPPLWRPHPNCGDFSETLEEAEVPWKIDETDPNIILFITEIELRLSEETPFVSDRRRAEIIYEEVKRLFWQNTDQFCGFTVSDLFSLPNPTGNCVDATIFLAAFLEYFGVESVFVTAPAVSDSETRHHACVGIRSDKNSLILVDLTMEDGFDVMHPGAFPITRKAFLAIYYTEQGRLKEKSGDLKGALNDYLQAEELCPDYSTASLNIIAVYLNDPPFLNLESVSGRLAKLLQNPENFSAQLSYLRGYYEYRRGNQQQAQAFAREALEICPFHNGAKRLLETLKSRTVEKGH